MLPRKSPSIHWIKAHRIRLVGEAGVSSRPAFKGGFLRRCMPLQQIVLELLPEQLCRKVNEASQVPAMGRALVRGVYCPPVHISVILVHVDGREKQKEQSGSQVGVRPHLF